MCFSHTASFAVSRPLTPSQRHALVLTLSTRSVPALCVRTLIFYHPSLKATAPRGPLSSYLPSTKQLQVNPTNPQTQSRHLHMAESWQRLSFWAPVIPLSIIFPSSIHLLQIPFSLQLSKIQLCLCIALSLSVRQLMTSGLILVPGYCESRGNEHEWAAKPIAGYGFFGYTQEWYRWIIWRFYFYLFEDHIDFHTDGTGSHCQHWRTNSNQYLVVIWFPDDRHTDKSDTTHLVCKL